MKKNILILVVILIMAGVGFSIYQWQKGQSGKPSVDQPGQNGQYIKVEDIYGEWPIYYDKLVEFEGYAVFVYQCEPCPPGAVCEACFAPYYAMASEPGVEGDRYYKHGQIIVQHLLGEEIKQDHRYRVSGRLLPPEQAFFVDIVGIADGDYPVVKPLEPAEEIK